MRQPDYLRKTINLKLKLRVAQNPCYKHTTKEMEKVLITDRFESIGLKKGMKFHDSMQDTFTTDDGEKISLSRIMRLFPKDFENLKRPTDEYLIKKGILSNH